MLTVKTTQPNNLLARIRREITNRRIETWESTESGSFTHTPASGQWKNKAWFRPSVGPGEIVFNIVRPKGGKVSKEVYAVYHGRFSEMLLAHFDDNISEMRLTALAGNGDLV